MKLDVSYYRASDVIAVAQNLIGKVICTRIQGKFTTGIISETEAYAGVTDRASHAYGDRNTGRTGVMYQKGGVAYIYLCYGIHSLFNIVTGSEGIPHAVLVRSVIPMEGINTMIERRSKSKSSKIILDGPGKVCQAMGIHYTMSGTSLMGKTIWLEDQGITPGKHQIKVTPRIGVGYAGKDALLPYRFVYASH